MILKWQASELLSCLHCAWCGVEWPQQVPQLSPELRKAAHDLHACLCKSVQAEPSNGDNWRVLHALATESKDPGVLAERYLQLPASPHNCTADSLPGTLQRLLEVFQDGAPRFYEEMSLRTGPMRQQWEAYGPGLLNLIRRSLKLEPGDDAANVCLVQPVLGGYGQVYPETRSILLEAVLTNREPMLPETLRMAWLLSQLRMVGMPVNSSETTVDANRVRSLATIPATLQAGADLGIAEYSVAACGASIAVWQADLHMHQIPDWLPQCLMDWWDGYQSQAIPWEDACQELFGLMAG